MDGYDWLALRTILSMNNGKLWNASALAADAVTLHET